MEGQTLQYFAALINADGLDGFCILGDGARLAWDETPCETGFTTQRSCIDGNGSNYWEEFWYRRMYNKACTNLEAMRPRLVYLSNCKNVTVQDVNLINSPFWTNHLYRCEHVRYLDNFIYAPTKGVVPPGDIKQHGAPSSDAIDLDVCHDVLVHGCYMQVNDDAVVLKGGKGTWADKDPDNGPVYNVLVQNCRYGKTHGCLTLGSESIHDWNIVLSDIHISSVNRVLWLKMRPDTPQHYEKIRVENVTGTCGSFLVVRPWTQFFQPGDRPDMPISVCNDITFRNIDVDTDKFFDVGESDKYKLQDFKFDNCKVRGENVSSELVPFLLREEREESASVSPPLKGDKEGQPFYYSVPVADGNYKVTVTLGSKKRAAHTVVRAESRRLMVENCTTRKGEFQTFSFIVNKRSPFIGEGKKVSLKPRELDYLNWDDQLTLEFNGSSPAVESINIEPDTTATTIFLCGNSTVVDQEEEPWASWGQMIPRWFADKVAISNHAESGLTVRSFINGHRLEKVLSMLRKGDYVVCEFGHNDQKEHGAGDGAWYHFQYQLKQFIDQVREAGGNPIFVTPTQRRSFDDATHTKIQETHGDYPDAMRDVAKREGVPLIELHDMTRNFFETMGFEGSKKALVHYPAGTFPGQEKALADNTHFNPYGAYEVAKMVIMGMKQLNLPFVKHLREDWQDFDPLHPDAPDAFQWYPADRQNMAKPDGN
jgi:lysophospholipase L1-like esterase